MNFENLMYRHTNESLTSIIRGLDVNETDDIISVCGSGDQAFALLEYANSVLALDISELQVAYSLNRAEMLKEGDTDGFFARPWYNDHNFKRANKYLSKGSIISKILPVKSRAEKIRAKLGKIEIKHADDFLGEVKEGRFSKAYLSNILGWSGGGLEKHEERANFMKRLAPMLRSPGLIYISNMNENWRFDGIEGLELDKEHTKIANLLNRNEYWDPCVYRRKA